MECIEGDYVLDVFDRRAGKHYLVREMGIEQIGRCGNHIGKIFYKVVEQLPDDKKLTVDSFTAQLLVSLPFIAGECVESFREIAVIATENSESEKRLTYEESKKLKLPTVLKLAFAILDVNKEQIYDSVEIWAENKDLMDEIKKKTQEILDRAEAKKGRETKAESGVSPQE